MLPQNKNLRFLIKLLVSGGLLAAVFSMIPVTQVADALLRTKWSIVVLSFLVIASTHYLNSAQMYLITRHQGISLSVNQIFLVNLITKFYGLFLPGIVAGGAIRWYHFSKPDRKPAQALAAIILNRVLETSMLMCLGLGFWLIDQQAANAVPLQYLVFLVAISLFVYAVSFSRRAHALILRVASAWFVPAWAADKARKVLSALGTYEDLPRREHATVLMIAIARHLLGLFSLYMLALALSLDIDFASLGWIRSLVAIAMFIPFSISGLGVREVTFVALLVPYGIASDDALALSLLVFARGLAFALTGGIIEMKRVVFDREEFAK
jgi:uncharacterized protein (TIRG00374 family)